jgi:ParB-like chromosome segregation protein Spo0J
MVEEIPLPEIVQLPIRDLYVPGYYSELFPLGRDRTALKASIVKRGFLAEHAIVVRLKSENRRAHEIVAGVGRWEVMFDLGRETIPAIVKEFTDADARAYTAYDNLQASRTSTPLSVVQAIVLALDHAEYNKTRYDPKLVMLAANVKPATHRRARESLSYALDVLRAGICREVASAGVARIVAEAVRYAEDGETLEARDLSEVENEFSGAPSGGDNCNGKRHRWHDFEQFYTGQLPVNTFKRLYYAHSERAAEHRRRQQRAITSLAARRQTATPHNVIEVPLLVTPASDQANAPDVAARGRVNDLETSLAQLTEAESFNLAVALAARLAPTVAAGKKLPDDFAEALRASDCDASATYLFCEAIAKHLKPSIKKSPIRSATPYSTKAAEQSAPSLFDSLPEIDS